MRPRLDRIAQVVRLRKLRVEAAERTLRRKRAEVQEALQELDSAKMMRDAWDGAAASLEAWARGSSGSLHRWTELLDIRRRDFVRGCAEARRYVAWWEEQVEIARNAETEARRALMTQRTRCDALVKRQKDEQKHETARLDEATFEELADSAGSSGTGGRG
jgi:hypothetical protein